MKIALAQICPVAGDIEGNLRRHVLAADVAAETATNVVLFPELSLLAYEPRLAERFALCAEPHALEPLQRLCDAARMTIVLGAPTRSEQGLHISSIIISPETSPRVYSKQFLHADEFSWFVPGGPENRALHIPGRPERVALAVCYELSVPEHAQAAADEGAGIYAASVAKTADGVMRASRRLAEVAQQHKMIAVMANCLGESDGVEWGGGSAAWDSTGCLIDCLNDSDSGLLIVDTIAATAESVLL